MKRALKKAEEGDLKTIKEYIKVLKNPYDSEINIADEYFMPPNDNEKYYKLFVKLKLEKLDYCLVV